MATLQEKIAECKASHKKVPRYTEGNEYEAMIVKTTMFGKKRPNAEFGVNHWPVGTTAGSKRENRDGSMSEVVCSLY